MQKILDKMLRRGHAWKWLALVEKEGLKESCAKERREAWKTVTQRAFRSPEAFEEFFRNARGLSDRPGDLPGLTMLELLEDFVEGRGDDPESLKRKIASINVASLPLEPLKQRVGQWRGGAALPEAKLQKALDAFIARPGSVTHRHVDELSRLLAAAGAGTNLETAVAGLGPHVNAMRKLNHKSTVRLGLGLSHLAGLAAADRAMEDACLRLPAHLHQALMRPFLHQAASLLAWLKRAGKVADAADAAGSMTFLLHALAGPEAEDILKRLAPYGKNAGAGKGAGKDPYREVHGAGTKTIEEKAALLGRLRAGLRKGPVSNRQLGAFRLLYGMLLSDIEKRGASLDKREQAEVARVLAPVILMDLVFFSDEDNDLIGLLLQAAKAGCMDVRLALLSTIVSTYADKNTKLEAAAGRVLAQNPPPEKDDFSLVLKTAASLYLCVFPLVSSFSPMLEIYGDDAPIASLIRDFLLRQFDVLVSKMLAAHDMSGLDFFLGGFSENTELEEDFFGLQEDLEYVPAFRVYSELFNLVSCFPEGSVTRKSYGKYVAVMLGLEGGLDFIIRKLDELDRFISGRLWGGMRWDTFDRNTAIDEANLCLQALANKKALERAPLPSLDKLAALLALTPYGGRPREKLLVMMTKVLERRIEAGQQEAGAIRSRLLDTMARRLVSVKPRRPRRRKRGQ